MPTQLPIKMPKNVRPWTPGELEKLKFMREERGYMFYEIANMLSTVYGYRPRTRHSVRSAYRFYFGKGKNVSKPEKPTESRPSYLRIAAILLAFAALGFVGMVIALTAPVA